MDAGLWDGVVNWATEGEKVKEKLNSDDMSCDGGDVDGAGAEICRVRRQRGRVVDLGGVVSPDWGNVDEGGLRSCGVLDWVRPFEGL